MKIYTTEGIIIKRKNFGEADRMITMMTRKYGKLKVIAKGVRKITSRRAGHLEVFGQATFTLYRGKTFDSITEVVRSSVYTFPHDNLVQVSFAYYVCELVDLLLPEKQEQEDAYILIEQCFKSLSTCIDEKTCDDEVSSFAVELLRLLGFLPHAQSLHKQHIHQFVESIIEKKLKTPAFIQRSM